MSRLKTVTQLTSKTTAVEVNVKNFQINTVALTDAADTGFVFTVNNNKVYPESNIQLTPIYAGTTGEPVVRVVSRTRFSFVISVKNVGTAVLNAALGINVSIIG